MRHKPDFKKQVRFFITLEFAFLMVFCITTAFSGNKINVKTGTLKINFLNTANGKPVVLKDSVYTNPSGEQYNITKLKYYISNISLPGNISLTDPDNYHLIDAARSTNFNIPVKEGKYKSIRFLIGVDSIRNCSGAQEGALDPVNDMFWTWNTGYVMFKMEGNSSSSFSNKKRIEYHIGGYRFGNNVATVINLDFDEKEIGGNNPVEIFIEMNLDKYWASVNNLKISETPVCTLPGDLAKKIAANFPALFSINSIK